ncbi:unnamed protein product [Protopolystoma xenopodis]|uniref:Secreted protein n=1 Tax=Protopolystoma xenopodis TaxID=117903 RepID=A0A448WSJ3_9PLAT|nr:unnamed protein product [Protopolystoma xenopodis]
MASLCTSPVATCGCLFLLLNICPGSKRLPLDVFDESVSLLGQYAESSLTFPSSNFCSAGFFKEHVHSFPDLPFPGAFCP